MKDDNSMFEYLSGQKLYGDDFDLEKIGLWYEAEKDDSIRRYRDLFGKYLYTYHALNSFHGYRHLPRQRWRHVLGFGSAYGDEFAPMLSQIDKITIVEPSDRVRRVEKDGEPVFDYIKPVVSGTLPFADESFDLITCFGVLHHVPNVTHVVKEFSRCLKPGGYALVREPIISLGDWTRHRQELTRCERGIPVHILREIIARADLLTFRESLCWFPGVLKVWNKIGKACFNSPLATRIDWLMSLALSFNTTYHRPRIWQKFGPTSVFFVLKKKV